MGGSSGPLSPQQVLQRAYPTGWTFRAFCLRLEKAEPGGSPGLGLSHSFFPEHESSGVSPAHVGPQDKASQVPVLQVLTGRTPELQDRELLCPLQLAQP